MPLPDALPVELTAALADRYRVERELGAGGMATVYLAQDLKHDRHVALKVLKPELGAILGVERFLAEIKVTANLQHPNLLPLFDSGAAAGLLFYVMPFVAGETLRARLDRETQLPIDDAVRIAIAIAGALGYAHEHGVIHRDLKPENVLMQAGQPVIADFGIALAVSNAGAARVTQTGMSLGTPQYMSPEQAAGDRVIDGRTDIYALGAMTYEMIGGEPPHTGANAQAIIAKLMTAVPPSLRSLRASVPVHVADAVATALEKLPADRFEHAKAFADALANPAYRNATGAASAEYATAGRGGVSKRLFAGVAVLAAASVAFGAWGLWRGRGASGDDGGGPVRFALTLASDTKMVLQLPMAISPDGKTIVFPAIRAGVEMLFKRELGDSVEHAIPGTEGGYNPFFSPDGTWVGYVGTKGTGDLQKVQLSGGPVVQIVEKAGVPGMFGGAWSKGDVIIAGAASGAMKAIAAGGAPKVVTPLDTANGEIAQSWPQVLDDGDAVLYTSWRGNAAESRIAVASLAKGTRRSLELPDGLVALGVLEGKLIYISATGTLTAVPFDAGTARVTGAPVAMGDALVVGELGIVQAAVSRSGTLVYQSGSLTSQLVLADREGHDEVLVPAAANYHQNPRYSPDGKRVAYTATSLTASDIWIYDIASRTPTRLTTDGLSDRPEWTRDGKRVLHRVMNGGKKGHGASAERGQAKGDALWWRPSDGSGPGEPLQSNADGVRDGVISPDGLTLAYVVNTGALMYRRLDGDTTSKPIASRGLGLRFSPDGKWVVYRSGPEVFVQAFPTSAGRVQLTTDGGKQPVWAPDGRHIYYVATPERLMVATVTTAPTFSVTSREVVSEGTYSFNNNGVVHAGFDVAPDGKHLLLEKPTNAVPQLVVVHDWKYELRQRTAPVRAK